MSLLASLLYSLPPAPLPKQSRKVVAPEMKKQFRIPARSDTDYGTVQPRILEYLKTVEHAAPNDVAEEVGLHKDSVRRGIRALHEKGLIECVARPNQGFHTPALWKAK